MNRRSGMRRGFVGLLSSLLLLFGAVGAASSEAPLILSLGDDQYLPKGAIQGGTGAQFLSELGSRKLEEVQLVILSNLDYLSLPAPLRDGLVEHVRKGGSLLITGGNRSFGSGGYGKTKLEEILPFAILYPRDWVPTRRGLVEPVAPNHPALSGLDVLKMPYVGTFNNLALAPGSTLIAQLAILYRQPLMAERSVGNGLCFGIAFDMREISGQWAEKDQFSLNLIRYLLRRSGGSSR
ncbi:MAG: glutamine amidotransferase [candidate division NC10 bacterium]|nr:glutamine amidotransferase [candidate division NC10 bacterium]